ncbi:MAG: hypothetical protein HZA61_13205 [Candidatus Eisenbacteria bacterium]|uniref:Porin n=1 Tax=Eiseniibacteriota bacterium TaxID=2212470 RepID=A0A933W2U3_UNCEI|nr:hypothetical protein [Candidatus Eisenbacteria bacterium]
MTRVRLLLPLAAACLGFAVPCAAGMPSPLTAARFAFPGSVVTPASGASAGLALADRWIAEDVAVNPAARPGRGLTLSPQLVRVSRQDLSAANREFEQVDLNVDFAGAQLSLPVRGFTWSLYASQPQLRVENQSFVLGRSGSTGPSATLQYDGSTRETRGGVAVAKGERVRWGAAVELTSRDDQYQVLETSGSPDAGLRDLTWSGSAFGGAFGLRWERRPNERGGLVVGGGLRLLAPLSVTGTELAELTSGDSRRDFEAERGSTYEAGLSARWTLSPESGVYASGTQRGAEKWDAFGVGAAAGQAWAAGIDYLDPEAVWGGRVGVGLDVQPGTPEPRAKSVGVGIAYHSGETVVDLGVLHRAIARPASPTLSDDRIVASVRVAF